ncbi:MAG: hypothetical protein EU547_06380, partial [Promethearchaeota archaeon]
ILNKNTNLQKVFNYLSLMLNVLKADFNNCADRSGRTFNKIEKLKHSLSYFIQEHKRIQVDIKPKIERTFNIEKLVNPYLITVALFTPSTKNTFYELERFIQENHPDLYEEDMFEFFINFGDIAQGLATLGDSALKLSVTHILWDQGIIEKGKITRAKERIEQNSNLSKYCDKIELYEHRIYIKSKFFDPKPSTVKHIKGTLMEALLGIYYLENGFPGVLELIRSLEDQQKKFDETEVLVER